MPPNSRWTRLGRGILKGSVAFAWGWALLALWYWPKAPAWLSLGLATAWLLGGLWLMRRGPLRWRWSGLLMAFLLVRAVWEFNQPANNRDWIDYNARVPVAEFSGERVLIRNVRVATWRIAGDYELHWEDRTYSLDRLATVDFVVSPFALRGTLAHTLLSFGFEGGDYVAVSVEVRKERGETYSPLKGMFRHYETLFVIGDETDVLGLRTQVFKDPVHVFPMRASREEVRALFESILRDATQLARQPEFYNSVVNTCHLRLLRHVDALRTNKIGWNWRNYLPGYADELALQLGLMDFNGDIIAARRKFLINERCEPLGDSKAWSKQIRTVPGE